MMQVKYTKAHHFQS